VSDHLRLATDGGKPTLQIGPIADVASEARAFADEIDDGQLGKVDSAIVITHGSELATHCWGDALDLITAIGVLESAKHHILQRLLDGAS
jgi:hypothetical protein